MTISTTESFTDADGVPVKVYALLDNTNDVTIKIDKARQPDREFKMTFEEAKTLHRTLSSILKLETYMVDEDDEEGEG